MDNGLFQRSKDGVRFTVRLTPRSSVDRIEGIGGGVLKIRIKAAPLDGRANAALIKLLAKTLRVQQRDIRITVGESSRTKIIEIVGLDPQQAENRLI
jgi:uncharacterized protein